MLKLLTATGLLLAGTAAFAQHVPANQPLSAPPTTTPGTMTGTSGMPGTTTNPGMAPDQTPTQPTTGTSATGAPAGGQPVPATAADITAGANVNDSQGVKIGTVDSVASDGVVVTTDQGKVKLPSASFGKNSGGLMIAITKADLDAQIAKAKPAATPGS